MSDSIDAGWRIIAMVGKVDVVPEFPDASVGIPPILLALTKRNFWSRSGGLSGRLSHFYKYTLMSQQADRSWNHVLD